MPQPSNKIENIDLLKNLITKLGIKRIIETDYKTHDHKIAFTSQLCHVIASSLVDSAEDNKITSFKNLVNGDDVRVNVSLKNRTMNLRIAPYGVVWLKL